MDFTKYTYLWPPRPKKAIPVSMMNFYQKRGFVGQYKKNGTCNVMYVTPEREVIAKTRHDTDHKAWQPTEASSAIFKALPGDKYYVFITELMHSKVRGLRDTHYIHDVVVADGEYLVGKTFIERQAILAELFLTGNEAETYSHYVLNDNVWLAKLIEGDFKPAMAGIQEMADKAKEAEHSVENEGLVLKDPNAKLVVCGKQTSNSNWQVKCRVQHKNYSF